MRWSITTRIVAAVNLVVLAVGLVTGWLSVRLVGEAAEDRLLREPAANAAMLVAALRLPCSERLARDLARLTGSEVVLAAEGRAEPLGSSLPEGLRGDLAEAFARGDGLPERLSLGGRRYVLASAAIPEQSPPVRLVVLMPAGIFTAVARRGIWRVIWVTLAATLVTTVLGTVLARSVTRPLRRLAGEAERMTAALEGRRGGESGSPAAEAVAGGSLPGLRFAATGAPAEVASLAGSFNQVLERLEAARRDLEHAARLAAVGRLAASVVHELRNPLCGIQMNARVLADAASQNGQRDPCLDLIVQEVERMDLYLHELLTLSARPTPLAAPAAGLSTALESAVSATQALIAGRARHLGVAVHLETAGASPVALAIDAVGLRQVLLNLAFNALDAMPEGGTLTLSAERQPCGWVRIEVRDTGHGLAGPPEEDLFAPFVSHRPGGSGLGLTICRQIVERHGGRIGYTAVPNAGMAFWFELPAATATGGDAAAATCGAPGEDVPQGRGRPRTSW